MCLHGTAGPLNMVLKLVSCILVGGVTADWAACTCDRQVVPMLDSIACDSMVNVANVKQPQTLHTGHKIMIAA